MRLSFFDVLKWRISGTLMADAGRDPGTLRCAPRTGLLQSFVAPRRYAQLLVSSASSKRESNDESLSSCALR